MAQNCAKSESRALSTPPSGAPFFCHHDWSGQKPKTRILKPCQKRFPFYFFARGAQIYNEKFHIFRLFYCFDTFSMEKSIFLWKIEFLLNFSTYLHDVLIRRTFDARRWYPTCNCAARTFGYEANATNFVYKPSCCIVATYFHDVHSESTTYFHDVLPRRTSTHRDVHSRRKLVAPHGRNHLSQRVHIRAHVWLQQQPLINRPGLPNYH